MDRKIRELLGLLESEAPPEGLKERLRGKLAGSMEEPELNRLQRLVFANPLGAAGLISLAVSGLLWAVLGNGYPAALAALFFAR